MLRRRRGRLRDGPCLLCFQAAFFLLLLGLGGAGLALVGELLTAGHKAEERHTSDVQTPKGEKTEHQVKGCYIPTGVTAA